MRPTLKRTLPPLFLFAFLTSRLLLAAQSLPLAPLPDFAAAPGADLPVISRESVPGRAFSVVGPRGALLGDQNGEMEAWIFPWKLFSGLRITASMDGYPAPIDLNRHAAWIDVQPDHTTITYSHPNFTVEQIMLAPGGSGEGAGVLVLYRIRAIRPMTLTFSLDPEMQRMWPAPSPARPSPEWVAGPDGSGFYLLRGEDPAYAAALAMPGAGPGILPPYQEGPVRWPLQFVLRFDPQKDRDLLFPLLLSLAVQPRETTPQAVARGLVAQENAAAAAYAANQERYAELLRRSAGIETPDSRLNAAYSWAVVSIDQLRVQTTPDHDEEALTAGFLSSGDGARPGFGWFFGRDALWTLYAVNSYGDFETTRREIEFLLRRQSPEGKIMHEWSQTAGLVDWGALPYEYAAADSTPLLLMAMDDYWKIAGDAAFLRAHWEALALAWRFETTHVSADGIYNNEQGTGWVESWIPFLPHQEIYLAALDEQASLAFADLARAMGKADLAEQAAGRAGRIAGAIEKEYYLPSTGFYAFSRNLGGGTDDTPTIFPAVAWWDGSFRLQHGEEMPPRWASEEFSTDWGTRLLSDRVSFYDPISYHQGSVWPLFTGWVSVAEYRTANPQSAYAHLMQNANLTWADDLGSVTELLSGRFYQVFGSSTAHQLWSSAMVISPILRGMFGLGWDAGEHTLTVNPQLPADWNRAEVNRLPLGQDRVDLTFTRRGRELIVRAVSQAGGPVRLRSSASEARMRDSARGSMLRLPLPPLEFVLSQALPPFGSETRQMKVLSQTALPRGLRIALAAPASSRQTLTLRQNGRTLRLRSADARVGPFKDGLAQATVDFPAGAGYVTKIVTFTW